MFSKKPILLILLQLSFLLGKTQQANFIKYTVYDGLVANPIRCIYQDSKGFIWIGTFEGLSRYDGYKFTNYTTSNGLSHNFINSFFEIDGKLLIAENNGAIDVIQNNRINKGLKAASAVNIISPYKDRLLLSTDGNGFYEYKKDTIVLPAQEKTGTSLGHFIELSDSLLLSDGVDDHLIIYKNDLSVRSSLKNLNFHFYSLFRDSKNRLWACTAAGLKLLEIHPGKKDLLSFAPLPSLFDFSPLKNSPVTSMIEDKDGSFWIGTMKGLVRLFPGGNFHVHNEKDGLPSAIINTLFSDKEDNLWIGTALGLAKWVARNHVVFYNTEHKEFRNDLMGIVLSNHKKIILTAHHGLQSFDVEAREFKTIKPVTKNFYTPVPGTSPLLVHYADTIGMLDTARNIISLVTKLDTIVPAGISCRHPDGTIFLGSFEGLFAVKTTLIKKILPYRITSLVIDGNGNVWAGTWLNGFYRIAINNNNDTIYNVQNLTPTIGQEQIRGLYADSKNNIWVGTRYGGAYYLTPKNNGTFDVQHFTRQSGLMCDWINSFAETRSGDMWVGSYLGLDKLVKESSGYRVFNFSKAVNFFAEIRGIVSTGGDYWVCVANTGIACFKDENLHQAHPFQATILSTSLGVLENKLTIPSPT
ncbi:MAG TPA: two-component regulator propeller domain-containing protein, partial [Chitinophagaceae bacterium]|nr:two-component regulator propeller domain-containing protein [Chitinophagaceae bacterium]